MNRMNGTFLAMLAIAVLAVAVFFLADLGGDKVYATPEAVFEASQEALQKNDMRTWCGCLTDDSRDLIAASFALQEFAKIKQGDDKNARAISEVFERHGLTPEILTKALSQFDERAPLEEKLQLAEVLLRPVSDRNSFFAEMFQIVIPKGENRMNTGKNDKLSNVKIAGKKATATITSKDAQGLGSMTFVKQGDGWRIDIIAEAERPMPQFPPGHPR